ncbi:hypothetical protein [Aureimonas flava]|nr:hypothetical protein [Aureimonas flava]
MASFDVCVLLPEAMGSLAFDAIDLTKTPVEPKAVQGEGIEWWA